MQTTPKTLWELNRLRSHPFLKRCALLACLLIFSIYAWAGKVDSLCEGFPSINVTGQGWNPCKIVNGKPQITNFYPDQSSSAQQAILFKLSGFQVGPQTDDQAYNRISWNDTIFIFNSDGRIVDGSNFTSDIQYLSDSKLPQNMNSLKPDGALQLLIRLRPATPNAWPAGTYTVLFVNNWSLVADKRPF